MLFEDMSLACNFECLKEINILGKIEFVLLFGSGFVLNTLFLPLFFVCFVFLNENALVLACIYIYIYI